MAYETQDSLQSRRDHGRTSGGTDIRIETSRGPGVAAVGGAVALVLAVAAIALLALGPSLTTERVADPAGAPAGGAEVTIELPAPAPETAPETSPEAAPAPSASEPAAADPAAPAD